MSTLYAASRAAAVIHVMVDRINDHMMTPAIRYDPQGFGTDLRKAREAKQRLATAKHRQKIAKLFDAKPNSRQVERAYQRRVAKDKMTALKRRAMAKKNTGGMAAINAHTKYLMDNGTGRLTPIRRLA